MSGFEIDTDAILENNPNVDTEQLREAQRQLEELRDEGRATPEYNIQSPYEPFVRRA